MLGEEEYNPKYVLSNTRFSTFDTENYFIPISVLINEVLIGVYYFLSILLKVKFSNDTLI